MVNPVPGHSISTPFGVRGKHWSCLSNQHGGIHTGADWKAPMGTPIVAPIAGTIRHRSYGSAFGPYQFAISPSAGQPFANGEVFFGHVLSRLPDGTEVQAGQVISKVGSMGNSTGPHLHMEYMPNTKGRWSCGLHADPEPVVNAGAPVQPERKWKHTQRIMSDMLGFDEPPDGYPGGNSDTIKELQWRLNNIRLQGGQTLPETGSYWVETDQEVRLWQQQICNDAPDAPRKSYLGPRQRARMFPADIYEIVDRGLPRVAGGGGVVDPPPVDPPAPPPSVAWFGAPALLALRAEIDSKWPTRDKSSDGIIGDYQHSQSKSEHNPVGHKFGPEFGTPGAVHAIDITTKDIDPADVIDRWLLRDPRVWYVIYNGHIWSKTYNWEKRKYTGSNPHNSHFHMSLAAEDQVIAIRNEANVSKWEKTVVTPPPVTPPTYVTREEYIEDMKRIADAFGKATE